MSLISDKRVEVPIRVSEVGDGTYIADYVAPHAGNYTLNVQYGGVHVPQSPLKIQVAPQVDVSKIKVEGLERSKFFVYYYE